MTLRELLEEEFGDVLGTFDDAADRAVGVVQDWLSQQETADVVYVAQTQTGVGPPLSAITRALVDLAGVR